MTSFANNFLCCRRHFVRQLNRPSTRLGSRKDTLVAANDQVNYMKDTGRSIHVMAYGVTHGGRNSRIFCRPIKPRSKPP